ncbi:metal-dependent hydrolase [Parasphingorhabdus halotolerans]|nr:metal-dependent hydrolase [Parasphingorhabdus halotolerans]
MSHAAVPIAGALMLGRGRISVPVLVTGIAFAMLPDADVIGFRFGVDYADSWGHRGATHSFVFAAAAALLAIAVWRPRKYWIAAAYLFIAMASHGLLDMLTNGGLGAALFWPFDHNRYFASITPIAVSPIGIDNFISERGFRVLVSEVIWIWTPLSVLTGAVLIVQGRKRNWRQQNGMAQ